MIFTIRANTIRAHHLFYEHKQKQQQQEIAVQYAAGAGPGPDDVTFNWTV